MKKRSCKPIIIAFLSALLLFAMGCGGDAPAPEAVVSTPQITEAPTDEPTAEPTAEPTPAPPAQRAAFLVPDGLTSVDDAQLIELQKSIDENVVKTNEAATALGLSEDKYFRTLMDELIPEITTFDDALADAAPSEKAARLLYAWSFLDDLSLRAEGYIGICRALCEGNDRFNMKDDARDLTGDGAWPSGYFFDGLLPALSSVDTLRVCEEYLCGYGMDEPMLAAIGKDEMTLDETIAYAELIKANGLYSLIEIKEDENFAWYGCWVADDGRACYLWVEFSAPNRGSFIQELCGNKHLTVMAGNFDFYMCIQVALS